MIDVLPVLTPTLPPATHTNIYRVGRMVFDVASPWADEQARTLAWVRAFSEDGRNAPVDTIVLTHHHADHVGGADALRRSLRALGVHARILAHADSVLPFDLDGTIADGEVLDTLDPEHPRLTAMHTPGHANGHLVYIADDGDVIAGDMVAGIGTILVAPPEGHLGTYLESLRRMLPVSTRLFPAHGPMLPGPETIQMYLAHRTMRSEQVRSVVAAMTAAGERADPLAVAERVYSGVPGVDLGAAALQVAGILEWLADPVHPNLRGDSDA